MSQSVHGLMTAADGIHYPWFWVWNDSSDRAAATAEAEDLYKVGYQIDTNQFFVCTDTTTPTFEEIGTIYSEADVSNPPTAAELNAEFPSAYAGFKAVINDSGLGSNAYLVWYDGTDWWIHTATVAA